MKSMKAGRKASDKEHKETLQSIAMVTMAYYLGGRLIDAEKLEV